MKKNEEFIRNESYEQVKISVIHNLVAKKMSLKDISEVINLPIDEVKRIINSSRKEKKRIKPFLFYLLFKFHV